MNEKPFDAYYREMIVATLATVVERTLRRSPEERFIDTKFSVLTGKDFPVDDPLRGEKTLYLWVQGRGMEALASHDTWLASCPGVENARRESLREQLREVLTPVVRNMEALRSRSGGRIYFMMSPDGTPLTVSAGGAVVPLEVRGDEPSNMSELFYVKGLASAAALLGERGILSEACAWYRRIHADIMSRRFYNDQQCLDPKNLAVQPVPGRQSHAPKMIALGAAFRFLELCPDREWLRFGMEYLEYIVAHHVNLPGLRKCSDVCDYAFWEFVDETFGPWLDEEGRLISDPGHALEFVGLGFKFLETAAAAFPETIASPGRTGLTTTLCGVLQGNFEPAFSGKGIGICKLIDLLSGRPINADMPWWNLPETMRAAAYAAANDPANRPAHRSVLEQCSNAFREHYALPDRNLFSYQTLDTEGRPVDVIPGTPDADACYHTNLSLMDALRLGM